VRESRGKALATAHEVHRFIDCKTSNQTKRHGIDQNIRREEAEAEAIRQAGNELAAEVHDKAINTVDY